MYFKYIYSQPVRLWSRNWKTKAALPSWGSSARRQGANAAWPKADRDEGPVLLREADGCSWKPDSFCGWSCWSCVIWCWVKEGLSQLPMNSEYTLTMWTHQYRQLTVFWKRKILVPSLCSWKAFPLCHWPSLIRGSFMC